MTFAPTLMRITQAHKVSRAPTRFEAVQIQPRMSVVNTFLLYVGIFGINISFLLHKFDNKIYVTQFFSHFFFKISITNAYAYNMLKIIALWKHIKRNENKNSRLSDSIGHLQQRIDCRLSIMAVCFGNCFDNLLIHVRKHFVNLL
jgi:hypothetical protein